MSDRLIQVALPLPLQQAFSYRVPGETPLPERGVRVLVPFGPRRVIGVVTGPAQEQAGIEAKDVIQVIDEAPLSTPALLDVCEWMADHYLAPPGECLRLALPPGGVQASRARVRLLDQSAPADDPVVEALRAGGPLSLKALAQRLGRDPSARLLRLRREGVVGFEQQVKESGFRLLRVASLAEPAGAPRGKAQAVVLERLRQAGGRLRVVDLLADRPSLRGALDRLVELGSVQLHEERELRGPDLGAAGANDAPEPTVEQARVLEPILDAVAARRYTPFLLHGVTGSGKTEVYLRAAEAALAIGRGVLLLVPEIALTPLLVRSALGRFGKVVAVIHSELSLGERHDQWWRIREGDARVVVGARSAVFAPIPDLGLLVVDEEHEAAYKQEESPRYHARDVAVVRARRENAPVLLGSATPSLESHTNALTGKYTALSMPTRVGRWGLPRVEVVDRRAVLKAGGDTILSPPLQDALALRLERKEQSLLLLNRRGWAQSLLCRECGEPSVCPNCSVPLTLHHMGGRIALCHYCDHRIPAPTACPTCKGEYLKLQGFGTERVVEALRQALPAARVDRLDRDLAQRKGAAAGVLQAFAAGELDILVGTQMIAKGHDFARVTLVGVVDADVGLGLPDFRAAERTFQLLTQVAGRAGRAELAGEVILQSHWPDHYALRLACAQDYLGFYQHEIEFRRTMGYPPALALVNVVIRAREAEEAARAAADLARRLRGKPGYRVLGPAAAPLSRLRQEHRFQVLLKGSRGAMRAALRQALVEQYGPLRWPGVGVDVDPISVL